jgi:hypothetical protein
VSFFRPCLYPEWQPRRGKSHRHRRLREPQLTVSSIYNINLPAVSVIASSSFTDPPSPSSTPMIKSDSSIPSQSCHPQQDSALRVPSTSSATKANIVHPYARLYAKKEEAKRRKIWNHALEKSIFSTLELLVQSLFFCVSFLDDGLSSTMGAPHRRSIYVASLEAHVDRLHTQLLKSVVFSGSFGGTTKQQILVSVSGQCPLISWSLSRD